MLSIIYVCNCIVTILQYYNVPLGWAIPAYFNDNISDISAQYERYTEREGSAYNISLAAGLFWSSVSNGYFCATVLPIITYKAMSSQFSTKSRAIALLILTIGMVAIFTIQQRAAFALLCVYLLIVFKKFIFSTRHIFAKMIILLVVIAGICTYSTYDVDFGRLTLDKVEGDSRVELLETLSQIPLDDWLCGTDVSNVNLGLSAGHNAILDSFRRGGILCLLLFIVLYLSLLYKSLRIYFRTSKQKHFLQSSLALSCIFFLAYSLLHSVGVQSGSPLFWILYTLMLSSINLEYSHKFITSQSSICKYRTA